MRIFLEIFFFAAFLILKTEGLFMFYLNNGLLFVRSNDGDVLPAWRQ